MADRAKDDIFPYGLAALALGGGILLTTLISLAATNVSYTRTQGTAWLSMGIAAVAILAYAAGRTDRSWFRAFWTAGFLALIFHFWWAIFRTYEGSIDAVIMRQTWAAYANFVAITLWALDLIAIWLPDKVQRSASNWLARTLPDWIPETVRRCAPDILHGFVWMFVTATFLVSTAGREGVPEAQYIGYAFGALVAAALVWRLRTYIARLLRPDDSAGSGNAVPAPETSA